MHSIYLPDQDVWDVYFQEQTGGNSYFQGAVHRRNVQFGGGIGLAFSAFLPLLIPIARNLGKHLGKEGLSFGSRVLGQLAEGEPLLPTLKNESRRSAQNLASKAKTVFQSGNGKRRKNSTRPHSIVGKKLRADAPSISSFKDPFEL